MFKAALELIQQTARDAQATRLMPELSGDGRKAFVQQGGEIKEFDLAPPARRHHVHSLVDLILYARQQRNKSPIVWHGVDDVVLLTDDADRRDFVFFPLTHSTRFLVLRELAEKKPAFDQAKFIRLLRIDLGLDNVAVVAQFRKLDFTMSDVGVGDIKHGQSRLGKEIAAKIEGIADLPEELPVPVPIYQETGEREEYLVRCAVEIDPINRVFQLLPMPDELERVLDLAQAGIHKRLTTALSAIDGQAAIPVYYGEP
jgi:hypothetical protein